MITMYNEIKYPYHFRLSDSKFNLAFIKKYIYIIAIFCVKARFLHI